MSAASMEMRWVLFWIDLLDDEKDLLIVGRQGKRAPYLAFVGLGSELSGDPEDHSDRC